MHETRRWRLVCYDIRDPKRYRRVHKIIKGYGSSVQYSIFRCRIDDRSIAELRWRLEKELDAKDSLLVVDLCPSCAERIKVRSRPDDWATPTPSFVVVDRSQAPSAGKRQRRRESTKAADDDEDNAL